MEIYNTESHNVIQVNLIIYQQLALLVKKSPIFVNFFLTGSLLVEFDYYHDLPVDLLNLNQCEDISY